MDAPTTALPPAAPPANPHTLWRQILGLVAWVGVVAFLATGPVLAALLFVLGALTLADAWVSGVYKRPGARSVLNNSPMAWGIAMALLVVVVYPTYLLNRNKLRTLEGGNDFYWAIVAVGGAAYVLFIALAVAVARG